MNMVWEEILYEASVDPAVVEYCALKAGYDFYINFNIKTEIRFHKTRTGKKIHLIYFEREYSWEMFSVMIYCIAKFGGIKFSFPPPLSPVR